MSVIFVHGALELFNTCQCHAIIITKLWYTVSITIKLKLGYSISQNLFARRRPMSHEFSDVRNCTSNRLTNQPGQLTGLKPTGENGKSVVVMTYDILQNSLQALT